ncbi:MAG: magnesium chelatase ATPase subunit D, partial [Gammaproteobacteria bacterium]|nr:magnesium chelatase ATPase subunit D [Gammaproteobacteria bacterium]
MMRAPDAPDATLDAALVAALFAVDPAGTGGVRLRSSVHPVRDQWLRHLRQLLPEGTPWRRAAANIGDDRLLGGMDLAATLRAGRPIVQPGVLAEADGGVVILALAERLPAAMAARVAAALDTGEIVLCRESIDARAATRIGVVALDEGIGDGEAPAASLIDRLAFHLDFDGLSVRTRIPHAYTQGEIATARSRLARVRVPRAIQQALAAAALALGAGSPRV